MALSPFFPVATPGTAAQKIPRSKKPLPHGLKNKNKIIANPLIVDVSVMYI